MSVRLRCCSRQESPRENEMLNHQVKENEANKTPRNSANLPKSRSLNAELKGHY